MVSSVPPAPAAPRVTGVGSSVRAQRVVAGHAMGAVHCGATGVTVSATSFSFPSPHRGLGWLPRLPSARRILPRPGLRVVSPACPAVRHGDRRRPASPIRASRNRWAASPECGRQGLRDFGCAWLLLENAPQNCRHSRHPGPFSRFRGTVQQGPVERQETQIVQS